MDTLEEGIDLATLIKVYNENVDRELADRLKVWLPNFAHIHVHEVIGGMLARQATLAKEVANAPTLWNGHSAPIILRAMADVYINISWLLIEPESRCLKFISFGLGQAKLELEHRRAELGGRQLSVEEVAFFEASERWIDTQRLRFLQDVDLGKWAGLSVRQMADEADCIDFYNFVYTPFSACAHSMWHHIGRYNLTECQNPLHRFHRVPVSSEHERDIYYFVLAAKYLAQTMDKFAKGTNINVTCPSSYAELIKLLRVGGNMHEP